MVCPACPKLAGVKFRHPVTRDHGMCLSKLGQDKKCLNHGDLEVDRCKNKLLEGESLSEEDIHHLQRHGNPKDFSINSLNYPNSQKPIYLDDCTYPKPKPRQTFQPQEEEEYSGDGNGNSNNGYPTVAPVPYHTKHPHHSHSKTPEPCHGPDCESEEEEDGGNGYGKGHGYLCWPQHGKPHMGARCNLGVQGCFSSKDQAPHCGQSHGPNANGWSKGPHHKCKVKRGAPDGKTIFKNEKLCERNYGLGPYRGYKCRSILKNRGIDGYGLYDTRCRKTVTQHDCDKFPDLFCKWAR
jgi:hypothetical protein